MLLLSDEIQGGDDRVWSLLGDILATVIPDHELNKNVDEEAIKRQLTKRCVRSRPCGFSLRFLIFFLF